MHVSALGGWGLGMFVFFNSHPERAIDAMTQECITSADSLLGFAPSIRGHAQKMSRKKTLYGNPIFFQFLSILT
jgi:hypothetical protein